MVEIAQHHGEDGGYRLALDLYGLGDFAGVELDGIADDLDIAGTRRFQILPFGQIDKAEHQVKRVLGISVEGDADFFGQDEGVRVGRVEFREGLPCRQPFALRGELLRLGDARAVGLWGVGVEIGGGNRRLRGLRKKHAARSQQQD